MMCTQQWGIQQWKSVPDRNRDWRCCVPYTVSMGLFCSKSGIGPEQYNRQSSQWAERDNGELSLCWKMADYFCAACNRAEQQIRTCDCDLAAHHIDTRSHNHSSEQRTYIRNQKCTHKLNYMAHPRTQARSFWKGQRSIRLLLCSLLCCLLQNSPCLMHKSSFLIQNSLCLMQCSSYLMQTLPVSPSLSVSSVAQNHHVKGRIFIFHWECFHLYMKTDQASDSPFCKHNKIFGLI